MAESSSTGLVPAGAASGGAAGAVSPFGAWDQSPCSIEERFVGESGRRLQDIVWEIYCIEESATTKLFLKNGEKSLIRHRLNDRDEYDTRNHYVSLIEKHGWLKGVRGNPWAVAEKIKDGEEDSIRYHLISSATLTEAAYIAVEKSPQNPQVQQMLQNPVKGICVFHPKTPPDVLYYLKDLANILNGTWSKASFIERMRLIPTIESRWSAERASQNIKCRDSGYHSKLADFLAKFFPGKFDSVRDYSKAASVYNMLVAEKLWPNIERYMNQHVVFSTPGLSCHDIYTVFGIICKALLHHEAPETWKQLAGLAFRFAVPTDDGIPWVFRAEESMQQKFFALLAPIADSAVCKAAKIAKVAQEKGEPESTPDQDDSTKKRKRKAKAKAKAKTGGEACEAIEALTADGRATLVIDDIINAVQYCLQDVPEKEQSLHAIESCYLSSLTFVFTGSLEVPDSRPLKTWTKVRAWVKAQLVRKHCLKMRASDPDSHIQSQLDSSRGPGSKENESGTKEQDDEDSPDENPVLKMLMGNQKLGQKVAAWSSENLVVAKQASSFSSEALSEQHAFARVQVNFRKKIRELIDDGGIGGKVLSSSQLVIENLLRDLHWCLSKEFDDEVLGLARAVLSSAVEKDVGHTVDDETAFLKSFQKKKILAMSLETLVGVPLSSVVSTGPLKGLVPLCGAWTTVGDVRNFLGLRAAYAVAVLELVPSCLQQSLANSKVEGSNETLLTQVVKDMSTAVQLLRRLGGEKQHDELVVMDVSASDWTATWVKLLVGAQSISQPSFTARTESQWAAYKTDQTKKLMKKNLDELRKMAKPYLLKTIPPAEPCDGAATGGDAAANQVEVQLQTMKKEQLAELIGDELVADAKGEEAALVKTWSTLVADVAAGAKACSKDRQLLEDESLAGAISSAVASNLEPDMDLSLKDLFKRMLSGTSVWANVQQASALQCLLLRQSNLAICDLEGGAGKDKSDISFSDQGLDCISIKVCGKPGNLKAKLFYSKPADGHPPPKVCFYFGGKVSSTLWEAATVAGGAKNRLLLKCGPQDVCAAGSQKWGVALSPLPGMTNLQSPMWLPAWNVKVLKDKDADEATMHEVKEHVTIQCGHLTYEGEVACLILKGRFLDQHEVELTRPAFEEETWKKPREQRQSGVQSQVLNDEDDVVPLAPEDLAQDVASLPVKLFRHLLR